MNVMSWVTPAQVRFYVRNLEPIDDSVLQAAIDAAESYIRSRLMRLYPQMMLSDAPAKPPIPTIAMQLAASLVEARTLSITNIGASTNPYAQQLYQQAEDELQRLERGWAHVLGESVAWMLPVFAPLSSPVPVRQIRTVRRTGSGW
jgi:hypothetical protein